MDCQQSVYYIILTQYQMLGSSSVYGNQFYLLKHRYSVLLVTVLLVISVGVYNLSDHFTSRQCCTSISECEALTVPSWVECKQAEGPLAKYPFTQSCLYHNIYFILGSPTVLLTKLSNRSFENMKNRDKTTDLFRPASFVFT